MVVKADLQILQNLIVRLFDTCLGKAIRHAATTRYRDEPIDIPALPLFKEFDGRQEDYEHPPKIEYLQRRRKLY